MKTARLKKGGSTFEVVINPEEAIKFRRGQATIEDALVNERIYADAKKGLAASPQEIKAKLGCEGLEAAKKIIREGDVPTTKDMREATAQKKRAQIVQEIHKYGVDPRTNTPHPIRRIEAALEQSRAKIDENKTAQEQLKSIIRQLNHILPLKISLKRFKVYVPAAYARKCHGKIKTFGTIKKDEWQHDGSWIGEIELPGGLEADFYDLIASLTSGEAQVDSQ